MMKINPILLAMILPLAIIGCVGTDQKAAFNDVNKIVLERTGQPVRWRADASSNEIASAVEPLLKTNLTAHSAVAIALLNNRSLQAEFAAVGISQADLAQASRLQNIELAGSWRFPNRPPSGTDIEYSAAGNLLDLLTLPAKKKIAAQNLEQTKLRVADKVLQLAAEVQTTFYNLQSQMEMSKRLNMIVEVNVSDGQINWQTTDELPLLPAAESPLENLESLAVHQRLDLAVARHQAESIRAALRLKSRTRFVPGVKLGVDTESSTDGQRITGPTLDLELPIFDQGQPALARLAAEFQQAKARYAAQEVNVRSEVREARDALLAAREAVEFSQKNLLPLRQKILGETLLQYNAMQKNSYDLLAAKEREQVAEQGRVEALRDYWLARVELERAVGGRVALEPAAPAPIKMAPSTMNMQRNQ